MTESESGSDGGTHGYERHIRGPSEGVPSTFMSNYVRTSKFTLINFFPKSLFDQFRRLANFYFLIIAVLQSIEAISPLPPITAILPLVFVVGISMLKNGVEDYYRYVSDKEINNKEADVLSSETQRFEKKLWKDIVVGDIVRVPDKPPGCGFHGRNTRTGRS